MSTTEQDMDIEQGQAQGQEQEQEQAQELAQQSVREDTLCYTVSATVVEKEDTQQSKGGDKEWQATSWGALRGLDDQARMTESGVVPEAAVEALWLQKTRMDSVFDTGKSKVYYTVRAALLEESNNNEPRNRKYWNKAGLKLEEVLDAMDILGSDPGAVDRFKNLFFVDVCGGPGAFSQVLFFRMPAADGAGITLNVPGPRGKNTNWYSKLLSSDQFTPVYGPLPSSNGDIFVEDNLLELGTVASRNGLANIVVADGLLKGVGSSNAHKENLEELFCTRIIVAELVAMFLTLREGGDFVIRFSDTFSEFSLSVVYVLSQVFESVSVVKPASSRIVSSERYVVAQGRAPDSPTLAFWRSRTLAVYRSMTPFTIATSLCDPELYKADDAFWSSICACVKDLTDKQTHALTVIMDEVDAALEDEASGKPPRYKPPPPPSSLARGGPRDEPRPWYPGMFDRSRGGRNHGRRARSRSRERGFRPHQGGPRRGRDRRDRR